MSALPDLASHVELMAVLRYNPWAALNGFGVDRTNGGVKWRLSAKSGAGVWEHKFFGEVEADTNYLVILSYETDGVDSTSEVWVTKLDEPDLLVEASPLETLTRTDRGFGDIFFIGAADYPVGEECGVSAISVFFDEMTLTEDFPATFGAWGSKETFGGAAKLFDFGTVDSPVRSSYTQVTESTVYSGSLGYGWTSLMGLESRDRLTPDDLRRDLVLGWADTTFNVDLANDNYQVTITIGDQTYPRDQIDIYAENTLTADNIDTTAATFQEITFAGTLSDDQLNIMIHDDGGNLYWTINAITITPN